MHSRRMRGVFHLGVIIEATYIQDKHGCAHERVPCHMVRDHIAQINIAAAVALDTSLQRRRKRPANRKNEVLNDDSGED